MLSERNVAPQSRELTRRQREVVELIAAGWSTKEIAAQLGVSESTAKWHVSRLFRLFDVPNRPALTNVAGRQGLLGDRPALRR